MKTQEFKKQFRATLFEDQIMITTTENNNEAFTGNIETKHEIKIGWHDWIETDENALNYFECCGILTLFGITPPEYNEFIQTFSGTYSTKGKY